MSEECKKAFLAFCKSGPMSDELLKFANEIADELGGFHMTKQDMRIAAGNFYAGWNTRPETKPLDFDALWGIFYSAFEAGGGSLHDGVRAIHAALTSESERIKELEEKLAYQKETWAEAQLWMKEAQETHTKQLAIIRDMREALEFYSNGDWNDDYPGGVNVDKLGSCIDTGNIAREVLAKYPEQP